MAISDRASERKQAKFEESKQKILGVASSLSAPEYFYLEYLLEELGNMIAYYSYGNGEVSVTHDLSKDEEEALLSNYAELIQQETCLYLTIQHRSDNDLSSEPGAFVTRIWFDDEVFEE